MVGARLRLPEVGLVGSRLLYRGRAAALVASMMLVAGGGSGLSFRGLGPFRGSTAGPWIIPFQWLAAAEPAARVGGFKPLS